MSKTLISSLIALGLFAAGSAAEAATRTVFISGTDLYDSGGPAASSIGANMPGGAAGSVTINLTLPKDFKSNSTATLQLRMVGGGTSCGVVLSAAGAIRLRPGAIAEVTPGPASGLTMVSPAIIVTPAAASQVFTAKFKLAPPASGTGQKSGDSVLVVVNRDGGGAGDTCVGSLTVTSVKFKYQLP